MTNKVFRLERDGNVLIVIPQGDASRFRYLDVHQESNTTLEVLDDPSLAHVVVDFTSEQMLGSIIISVVIKVCRKAGGKGGKAAFCNASPDMLEVLQLRFYEDKDFKEIAFILDQRESAVKMRNV